MDRLMRSSYSRALFRWTIVLVSIFEKANSSEPPSPELGPLNYSDWYICGMGFSHKAVVLVRLPASKSCPNGVTLSTAAAAAEAEHGRNKSFRFAA